MGTTSVAGNFIGTDASGTASLGNSSGGTTIEFGAQSNTIGGVTPGERNIISGGHSDGVVIHAAGTDNNAVTGNYIGTDVTGTLDLGNSGSGVVVSGGGQSNIIGGTTAGERNVISGNAANGVGIVGLGSDNNTVSGNYIGTDVTGTLGLGNSDNGILISGGAQLNTVGGATAGERNIISGNDNHGVLITDLGTDTNTVSGNYIGTDVTGIVALGNTGDGVLIDAGAQSNTIGGVTSGERNIISGNVDTGAAILFPGTDNNVVIGNYIGTDVTGTIDLGNFQSGVIIQGGAASNTVGGSAPGDGNLISGNDSGLGVGILGVGSDNNTVSGNFIGTDATGTAILGNSAEGAAIEFGQFNIIGGATAGERNVISGNGAAGVFILGVGSDNNTVSGNYIGTDVTGTIDLGNNFEGVEIRDGARSNTIGGTTADERNIISGNSGDGVVLRGFGTDNNTVIGNYIGSDVSGSLAIGNGSGITIVDGAQLNVVGGSTPAERNVISGNSNGGVDILFSGTDHNVVSGNYIGTDVTGTIGLGNGLGIDLRGGPQFNTVGGLTAGERNVISGNLSDGVIIQNLGSDNNTVSGNYIGTDVSGTLALGNRSGIHIMDGAQSNTIGGTTAGERNIISGNDGAGVEITGPATDSNIVSGNYIGTDVTGIVDLGNSASGIVIEGGAQFNTIGGTTAGERNIVSGNGEVGVFIGGSGTSNNFVSGNYIGTDVTGTADLGNSEQGVRIGGFAEGGAQSNSVGGTTAGERNIISGNTLDGVFIGASGTSNNTVSGNYIGTDVTGMVALGNSDRGVRIDSGAQFTTIGGTSPGERNVISGNIGGGIGIDGPGSDNNTVSGNYIGTDVGGTLDLGNNFDSLVKSLCRSN